jgi:phospholipase B1
VIQVINEYRGQSFAGGGDDTIEQTVTIPNILRTFNKHLYGYGVGIGKQSEYGASHLNVAVPGSTAEDLPEQAQELVKRLKNDPNVDFENDWKLITIFIGGNDVCAVCHDQSRYGPFAYKLHLDITIKTLYEHVPRAIVNIVGMIHVELLRKVGDQKATCKTMHAALCPCVADWNSVASAVFVTAEKGYTQATHDLMADGKYDKADFTVVTQPFAEDSTEPPLDPSNPGKVDLGFFAPDCFHFHQKGHNTVSRFMWNTMLQPVGQKITTANLTLNAEPIACPDKSCPFIRTMANSRNCTLFL